MNVELFDAVVIGAGAAGLSAAQSLGRARRRTLVLDTATPRNRFASHMHNVLGHDGRAPNTFLEQGQAELARYGVEVRNAEVRELREAQAHEHHDEHRASEHSVAKHRDAGLRIELGTGQVIRARAVVLASGLEDRLPEIPGLAERWGDTVLHCPYCHGWEVRDRKLGVITTSPMGLHQAKLVRQWSEHLTVFSSGLGEIDETSRAQFAARDVTLVPEAVSEIVGPQGGITAVRTADGRDHPVDAVFTIAAMVPRDAYASGLGLVRTETPMGSFIAVDDMQRTSHPRIWAAGNIVSPGGAIPQSMGAGGFAGAAANAALVEADFALAAEAASSTVISAEPAVYWEERYAATEAVWSGRVNHALAELAQNWVPGRSLDLGCGEGGDVLWLAERGWEATGIDLSQTAIDRGAAQARARGITGAHFKAQNLGDWAEGVTAEESGSPTYDLVTACFLQSPVDLPREQILRAAASCVAPGGRLVVVSHASPPAWAPDHPGDFPTPEEEIAVLALAADDWEVARACVQTRPVTSPTGKTATIDDSVVVVRRR